MSRFRFGFVLHMWNRMRTAEVRSRPGRARPQGLAWAGSPLLRVALVPQNEALLLCRRSSDGQPGRAAPFGCLRGQLMVRVLRNEVWSVANGYASVQMFMNHHRLTGQRIRPT